MDEVVIPSRDEANDAYKQFQACNDGPAFLRRARAVEGAMRELLEKCRQQREEWLSMVRLRLATLHALVHGDWSVLAPFLPTSDGPESLARLHAELKPTLRVPIAPVNSPRRWREALAELRESLDRFNQRWSRFLTTLDLAPLNELREGYNRYYVLEKECAFRSSRVAREGFVRLPRLTVEEILGHFPLLPA